MNYKNLNLYNYLFESGHTFDRSELLLKFKYRVINTILIVMASFTFLFGTLSFFGLNPLGTIQTISNFTLVFISIVLVIRLHGPKSRYLQTSYVLFASAYLDFVSALLFVPHDEFRIIWFYLLVFAAYITGGVRVGNIVSIISIVTVLIINSLYDMNISDTAIISAIFGLIIASFFIRAYTKKIDDFERELLDQESLIITQSRFAAMGEMMSMVAHQWRQPLSTTTLMITRERIKLMLEGKEKEEYDKLLEKISDTMVYLSDTIDDFQTYFQPEKETSTIDINEFFKRVLTISESRLVISNININIEKIDNCDIKVYVNELVQVFINIINNAIDAIEEKNILDGKILIHVKCLVQTIHIDIEDNAGGINEEIIEKVFEPYFSTKSKNGTGLGLYMSKMILEQHMEGVLSVSNALDGASFHIELPIN